MWEGPVMRGFYACMYVIYLEATIQLQSGQLVTLLTLLQYLYTEKDKDCLVQIRIN